MTLYLIPHASMLQRPGACRSWEDGTLNTDISSCFTTNFLLELI